LRSGRAEVPGGGGGGGGVDERCEGVCAFTLHVQFKFQKQVSLFRIPKRSVSDPVPESDSRFRRTRIPIPESDPGSVHPYTDNRSRNPFPFRLKIPLPNRRDPYQFRSQNPVSTFPFIINVIPHDTVQVQYPVPEPNPIPINSPRPFQLPITVHDPFPVHTDHPIPFPITVPVHVTVPVTYPVPVHVSVPDITLPVHRTFQSVPVTTLKKRSVQIKFTILVPVPFNRIPYALTLKFTNRNPNLNPIHVPYPFRTSSSDIPYQYQIPVHVPEPYVPVYQVHEP
ncbi:hypothetical protein M9458_054742, partial [Cirrhinus mrigala]